MEFRPGPGTVFIQYHVIVSQRAIDFWSLFRKYTITLSIDSHWTWSTDVVYNLKIWSRVIW